MNFWRRIIGYALLTLLAVGGTLASFQFIRPANCERLCSEPAQAPCPAGACRFGEQRAGFPLPMVRDAETGSPTGGWGRLGEEDYLYLNPLTFVGNVLFYAAAFWFLWQIPLALRGKIPLRSHLRRVVPAIIYCGVALFAAQRAYPPPPPWQPPTGTPAAMLLGTWRGHDPASGDELVFRFYDDQRVLWSRQSAPLVEQAEYRLIDDQTLRISFVEYIPGDKGMCDHIPAVFADSCNAQFFRPTASAVPAQGATPEAVATQALAQGEPGASPQPTMPPYDLTVSTLDAMLTLTVDAETLTLSLPSGLVQRFQRVTAP